MYIYILQANNNNKILAIIRRRPIPLLPSRGHVFLPDLSSVVSLAGSF